jgi:PST family polysaccharide transporter
MQNLKGRTIRGGVAKLCAQGINFAVRLGSLMFIARILGPQDFGLIGMVTAFTGVLGLFKDFGLSSAAVQRTSVTDAQISTLFWINVLVGIALTAIAAASAPAIAAFYQEPRLVPVTLALAVAFLFNALGVQHGALLQREMRFTALAVISTVSLTVSAAIGIGGATTGFGYWALVAMTMMPPLFNTIGSWVAASWIPGVPQRRVGMRAMMDFGGTLTLNGIVYYAATNVDKVLLGRFWGVDALGMYGRAYQLVNIPTDNLNNAAADVAFSALSRLKEEPKRFRVYFLKGYSFILVMTLPVTLACALFAEDVVAVVLGGKWQGVVPIFRLLAPSIMAFAMVNPMGWLLMSLGLVRRSLHMAMAIAPFMILGCVVGLPYGLTGVALGYSVVMLGWIVPAITWAVRGTAISLRDVFSTVTRPLAASVAAAGIAWGARLAYLHELPLVPRLGLELTILGVTSIGLTLCFGTELKSMCVDLFRELTKSSPLQDGPQTSSASLL